jgi:hypothetical protein
MTDDLPTEASSYPPVKDDSTPPTSRTAETTNVGMKGVPLKAMVLGLSVVVLNLPIVLYSLVYDQYPHLLTSIFYFGCFLLLARSASWLCRKVSPAGQRMDLVFGLQVMFCFLPGLFMGSGLAGPYMKSTITEPARLSTPASEHADPWSGYYQVESAVVRGEMSASKTETHTTRTGESTTRVTTTYHVAPLVAPQWDETRPVEFWVVREGVENGFDKAPRTLASYSMLRTRTHFSLEEAVRESVERHGVMAAERPVFVLELSPADQEWYRQYTLLSLAVLNALVLCGLLFLLGRGASKP